MAERPQFDVDIEDNLSDNSNDNSYDDSGLSVKIQLKRMKIILTLVLHGTDYYSNFISNIDDEDILADEKLRWLEDIKGELVRRNNLTHDKNTRGVPQKLEFLLRECLLMHRWQELAEILSISHQEVSCDLKRSTWKIGLELLYSNLFKNESNLMERMVKLFSSFPQSDVSPVEIQLDRLLYQLHCNNIDEAIQELQSVKVSLRELACESEETSSDLYKKALYIAYQGLMWYLKWFNTKESKMKTDSADIETETVNFALETHIKKMQDCFSSDEVKENIMVRDIFIKAERQALEMNGNLEAVEDLLNGYCSSNPENPNSHKFYYEFLCQTNASEERKIEVLRNFVSYVPSDPLVLTLCDMVSNNSSEVLKYLFDLLDYSCWKTVVDPWSRLAKFLETLLQALNTEDFSSVVKSVWSDRKDWWPRYHFTCLSITREEEIVLYKALVAIFLQDRQLFKYINKVKCSVGQQKQIKISEAENIISNKI